MAQADGPVTHTVLNVFVVINIPDVTTRTARNETRCLDWILIVALCVRVCATWNKIMRTNLKSPRFLELIKGLGHVQSLNIYSSFRYRIGECGIAFLPRPV